MIDIDVLRANQCNDANCPPCRDFRAAAVAAGQPPLLLILCRQCTQFEGTCIYQANIHGLRAYNATLPFVNILFLGP